LNNILKGCYICQQLFHHFSAAAVDKTRL
jgi:hypothetical protein